MAVVSGAGQSKEPIIEATSQTLNEPPTRVQVMLGDSVRPWLTLFVLAFLLWLLITYGGLLAEVIAVVFGGYLIHLAIAPLANRLADRRVPRGVTVLLLYIAFFSVLALIVRFAAPAA